MVEGRSADVGSVGLYKNKSLRTINVRVSYIVDKNSNYGVFSLNSACV